MKYWVFVRIVTHSTLTSQPHRSLGSLCTTLILRLAAIFFLLFCPDW